MSHWTDSARSKLDHYSTQVRENLRASGVDVNEVAEDLRRHVHEEVVAEKLTVVTEQDVERILGRIGPPGAVAVADDDAPVPSPPKDPPKPAATPDAPSPNSVSVQIPRAGWLLLVFGVLLPFGTVVFEFLTGSCAAVLFDPLPTLGHMVLTALVPIANLAVWLALRRRDFSRRAALGWLNGFALGVSIVYALLFLPFSPFALIGIIVYGAGLVPLAPLLAFICAAILRSKLAATALPETRVPGLWRGSALGVAALTLFTLPMILTGWGLKMAASPETAESTRGVQLLRNWGDDQEMLRACYGRAWRSEVVWSLRPRLDPETARTIYYRVTGKPFNAVPPPKLYAGRARWNVIDEDFTWDPDQGGDAVAGRVAGLSLINSRQDGFVDPDGAVAYVEWTLEFKNISRRQREARAQIELPPGAVVSRLTLWIDGEEREAAFGGRGQVKAAYKAVVDRRRDPVLVTTSGPDRIMVQCFPVPQEGGTMKARIGITAPLHLTSGETAAWQWPRFLERNFTLRQDFQHSLWIESKLPLSTEGGRLRADQSKAGSYALRGELSDTDLAGTSALVVVRRSPEVLTCWTKDTRGSAPAIVVQRLSPTPIPAARRVIFVLDGSQEMGPAVAELRKAVAALPTGLEIGILLARDGYQEVLPITTMGEGTGAAIAAALRRVHCEGGHDNIPALVQAWDQAGAAEPGVIVWIHGPQPMLLEAADQLRQRFEWRSGNPKLVEIQAIPGPNRVLEKLDGIRSIRSIARGASLDKDLRSLFATFSGKAVLFTATRERFLEADAPAGRGAETSSHTARLWAADEVNRLLTARKTEAATVLAARYQLVTPVSGAVVLETTQQYQQAGLEPVPPQSVPTVPEPSVTALFLLAAAVLLGRRKLWR